MESMAHIIGFRAEPRQFSWAVVKGSQREPRLIAHDTAVAPIGLDEAPALAWLRERARLVIEAHKPEGAVLRTPEVVARGGNTDGARRRLRLEGVLLEASQSHGLKTTTGALITISAMLRTRSAKLYLDHDEFRGLDMTTLPKQVREAVLAAVAGLPPVDSQKP